MHAFVRAIAKSRPVTPCRRLPWSNFKSCREKERAPNSPPPACLCKSGARPRRTSRWKSREFGPATSRSPAQGRDLVCQAEADALLSVNGVQVRQAVLRNGDVISIGALKIQFALSPVRQSSQRWREGLTWAALALLCLVQVAIIYRLMR